MNPNYSILLSSLLVIGEACWELLEQPLKVVPLGEEGFPRMDAPVAREIDYS